MVLIPAALRIPVTVAICIVGLYATGWLSAFISNSAKLQPIVRNVLGGSAAMALTWIIGHLFGVVGG
jgi:VIT1/CCC1 family predicted Fe2+/Mn2+ transporter